MAKVQKIGRVTFRELTNEEALQKYGSSFVFVGSPPASLEQAAKAAGDRAVKRLAEELPIEVEGGVGKSWGSAE
jgi:hypothetical protein